MVISSSHRQWFSYRGLAPHQFMPMLGVHKAINKDAKLSATLRVWRLLLLAQSRKLICVLKEN